jgi:hypothetical protein
MRRPVRDYIYTAAYYIGGNSVHYEFAKIPKDGNPFLFKHSGDVMSFKPYDKCEDSNLNKEITGKYSDILRVELELRKGAQYFPTSVQQLLDVNNYKGMIEILWKALKQVVYFNVPWVVMDINKANTSHQGALIHILLKYAIAKDKEILNDIAQSRNKDTRKNMRKALRKLLSTMPVSINDIMVDRDMIIALDKEAAAYFGEPFTMDNGRYGKETQLDNDDFSIDDLTYFTPLVTVIIRAAQLPL